MTRSSLSRVWAVGLLLCLYGSVPVSPRAEAQTDQTSEAQLVGKARALEVRGRRDLAKQVWQQVLNSNPNQPDALAGMARASKLDGRSKDADEYLRRLRAVSPSDPEIAHIQAMGTAQDESGKLQEAGRLAQAGQYGRAMTLLREVYGTNPPAGDAALSYYQTEAGSEEGRPHAIAGLRALIDKYPQDSRYQIALGKILTYNPRTRAEGRKLLARHPYDPDAQQAMRQSLDWEHRSPGAMASAPADATTYSAGQVNRQGYGQVSGPPATVASSPVRKGRVARRAASPAAGGPVLSSSDAAGPIGPVGPPPGGGQRAVRSVRVARRALNAEQRAAYAALNAKRLNEADRLFKDLLNKNPKDFQAAAGLGYVRMNQANFSGAISFFEMAEEDGDRDRNVEKALRDSRFYYTMGTATAALNANNLPVAEQEFQAALRIRPNDPQGLQGLGGTLLKGQQNDRALEVFTAFVRVAPGDGAAWRGLFMAEYGAARYTEALDTERRVPPRVRSALVRDPDFLRTLALVYLAQGRDAEAQRVFRAALELPFPANGAGLKVDTELQYAALLSSAGHKEQAIALYRQVLTREPDSVNAWVGVVQNEHELGQDAAAYEAIRTMPSEAYRGAMAEAGFETSVAAVYEAQGHDELAQQVLEQFLATEQAQGKQPFAPAEIQLAGLYLRHGDSARAYGLYKRLIETSPNNPDAWSGLLGALHATGHDTDAMAQLQTIPPGVRKELENNPAYLQTVGSIYAGLGDSQAALEFFHRVEQHYGPGHAPPSADMDVQEAWLLYNSHSDDALLRRLLALGDRKDLSDKQRETVATIWANFAVRRANQASAAGNTRLALAILNAAAQTFPHNPEVLRALAGGYAQAGMGREAVAIFKSQDLNAASAGDYRAAVGAALTANDLHDAEMWLRFGLDQYPRDPQMMLLAARFETARGDPNRAALYYRAALAILPPANPGAQLVTEMVQSAPVDMSQLPQGSLATLLAEANSGRGRRARTEVRPYLPSFTGGTGTVPIPPTADAEYGAGYGNAYGPAGSAMSVPEGQNAGFSTGAGYMSGGGLTGSPGGPDMGGYVPIMPQAPSPSPAGVGSGVQKRTTTLNDFNPHSKLEPMDKTMGTARPASNRAELHLHADRAMEAKYGPYVSYDTSQGIPRFLGTRTGLGDGVLTAAGVHAAQSTALLTTAALRVRGGACAPCVRFVRFQQTAAAPMFSPRPNPSPAQAAPDGTPIVPYAATARPAVQTAVQTAVPAASPRQTLTRSSSKAVQERAAEIRANQAAATPQMTGVSHPPAETYDTAPAAMLRDAQYSTPYANQYGSLYGAQAAQPNAAGPQGDSYGQQYPPPGTGGNGGASRGSKGTKGSKTGRRHGSEAPTATAPAEPGAGAQQGSPMQYPVPGQPLENLGPPQVGQPYPMGQAPTDYQLQQHNLPPLRAYWDPRSGWRRPLSERAQAEVDLAQIEGSYSGWAGGSVIGRYRSGVPGVDRLASLTVPFEASFVVDNTFRVSVIPKAVFLTSGTLDTGGGTLGRGPVLGTYLANAPNNPVQQFASGLGGEVQITTNTLGAAVGFTPYQFLVSNLIGRGRWRPGNSHFTLYGGRDAVEETQLSYAGLRDPGTATPTYGGDVWGGVVQSGGGVRFDYGDERAGFYLQGEGAVLTGYHVLQNQKADGLMGAYFRVKNWPQAGTLNIGGAFYGMHFSHNERGETYGLGGYFSPEAYFLTAVPVTFTGHYGTDLHYAVSGSLGVQTFQEDNETYFPLDPGLLAIAGCTAAQLTNRTCGLPVNSSTGLNFSFDSEASYRVTDHWYVGGFLSANNTNNYETVTGGFFARYTFRPQYQSVDYPTGMFPVQGFRPLRVP